MQGVRRLWGFTWKVAGNNSNTSVRWRPPPSWGEKRSYHFCILLCDWDLCTVLFTLYSTLCPCQCAVCMSTSLPIPIRYQYTLSPTSMVRPFRLAYIYPLMAARKHTGNGNEIWGHFSFDVDEGRKTSHHSKAPLICVYVYLTVHFVALYKSFIILQACARAPDVSADVFIQIPVDSSGYHDQCCTT